jgi:hypothetical protein
MVLSLILFCGIIVLNAFGLPFTVGSRTGYDAILLPAAVVDPCDTATADDLTPRLTIEAKVRKQEHLTEVDTNKKGEYCRPRLDSPFMNHPHPFVAVVLTLFPLTSPLLC